MKTKAERKAYDAARFQARKKEFLARNKAWRDANKDSIRDYRAGWRAKNKDKEYATCKRWRQNNAAHVARCEAARRAANPEAFRRADRKYKEANRDILRVRIHNRNAKKRASASLVSLDIVAKLMHLQKGRCIVCRSSLKHKRHLDHVVPLIAGGPHCDDNLQLLCPPCNLSKGAKDPLAFMRTKGLLL